MELKLSGTNRVCLIDDEDYETVIKHSKTWGLNQTGQVRAWSFLLKRPVQISRLIMGLDSILQVDHINRNRLDNRKVNLRFCSQEQNLMNKTKSLHSETLYKGVDFHKGTKKWRARIALKRKQIYLGVYSDIVEAAKEYDKKAKELFGEFACLNFPEKVQVVA